MLLFTLCNGETRATVGFSWPVSLSSTKLLGIFPHQASNRTLSDVWIVHCISMFRAAILLSQQYNITFQGEQLGYDEITTDQDLVLTVDRTCNAMSSSNIVGLVGPAYSREARFLSYIARRVGIISVSYAATSPDLSAIGNGAFYRVVPSDENTAVGIALLFQRYEWKSSIIIYQNDEYGTDGMQSLKEKFSEIGINTRETIRLEMNKNDSQTNWSKILRNSVSRIVILWADASLTTTLLTRAMDENLLGPDFVWILITSISLDYFSRRQKQQLIGILNIEPVRADGVDQPINTSLLNEAYRVWKQFQPETFPDDNNVNIYALFTFDATWAFILTLQKLCSTHSSCLEISNASNCYYRQFANSASYYETMRFISFLGVSGEVKFSNSTTDRGGRLHYLIKSIQPIDDPEDRIDYTPVLKWDTDGSQWTLYKNQSDVIIWPSQTTNIPADYRLIRGNQVFSSPQIRVSLKSTNRLFACLLGSVSAFH